MDDINILRSKRMVLETELSNYLKDSAYYEKEITATRGRLLRILYQEYKMETNPNNKVTIQNEINFQKKCHLEQLNKRISKNKTNSKSVLHQIPNELAFKFKKLSANINSIKNSQNVSDTMANAAKVGGNVISIAGSIAKVPISVALNLGSFIAPYIGTLLVQPLQIPVMYFSKLINPDSKYNGKTITNLGKFLGKTTSQALNLVEKGVRKI